MRFEVTGIGDYIGKCVYDEAEDALIVNGEIVLDFKKKYKDYLKYTKFMIHDLCGREWISFQFLPKSDEKLRRNFAIITAYNPKSMVYNDFINFLRNTELESVIKAFGYESYLSVGELFDYSEKSFIIYDITKKDALDIAKKFDQYSIFYNNGKCISIIECETGNDILRYEYKKHYV